MHLSTSQELFPKLSEAKVKAGIFVGPQVKRLMKSDSFSEKLSAVERRAGKSFVSVVEGFLENHKVDNFKNIVEERVDAYEKMGCRMLLKLHVLHSHIDEFKDNMGDYLEEQGERFHQDVKSFEKRYKGQYNESMMGDYIWNLVHESKHLITKFSCLRGDYYFRLTQLSNFSYRPKTKKNKRHIKMLTHNALA